MNEEPTKNEERSSEERTGEQLKSQSGASCGLRRAIKQGVLLASAAAATAMAANALIAWNTPPLGARLGGGFNRYAARHGDIAYSVSGSGAPLLLLHALRPGNSSAEWEQNFAVLAEHFTVYAPDFLGWGLSDKPPHFLRPADYAEQIQHFVEDVVGADASTPCAVIASGEACAFALMAAAKTPDLFQRFVLVCPTTSEAATEGAPEASTLSSDETAINSADEKKPSYQHPIYKLLTFPIVGRTLLNLLTSRARLESEASQQLFHKESLSAGTISRLHIAAHQPGTGLTLAAYFAGVLGALWRTEWEKLAQPALLVWGRNAGPEGFETAPEWLALKPDADLEVFDEALLLPHVEHADDFNARVLQWLTR